MITVLIGRTSNGSKTQNDVVNSYNDGPVDDGSIMGPFYEIEIKN